MFAAFLRFALLALLAGAAPAQAAPGPASEPLVHTEDVDRFYRVYEAAHGAPTAEGLQHDYLDPGSEGLHQFAAKRQLTGVSLAKEIAKQPQVFVDARRCLPALPGVSRRVTAALHKLGAIYPQASFPPITILIGRAHTAGTTSKDGVLIGLETLCMVDWVDPNVENRFVHMIAHEYGHVQQPAAEAEDDKPQLLFAALIEGGAEFMGEMISGEVGNPQLAAFAKGRERELESQFAADVDKTDLSAWLYNGKGTATRPGDLGYWAGYRVVKAYYVQAKDKRRAVHDLLHVDAANAKAFLAASGWRPGMALPDKVAPPS